MILLKVKFKPNNFSCDSYYKYQLYLNNFYHSRWVNQFRKRQIKANSKSDKKNIFKYKIPQFFEIIQNNISQILRFTFIQSKWMNHINSKLQTSALNQKIYLLSKEIQMINKWLKKDEYIINI
ncbi:hypothetical protein TTHERM_001423409 (macronuclear) [Tetrahymena thermophila SB210]|uniref:Uncharacterized protein n=1 Tax=Tetrahymena thermophila (strain SB210) TaxID=312017 RepID=W7XJI8_TETTS|nr:hypothetical protein TTHERM_001423409 [Tetrahymena thermophila SB210]EWS75561.1 hypothetical protein TTHERM_001423409 [Tetrahymena thermophila SB210]|eukprot:XP_012651905.1 hypothetical protein TTHERM_001423409 [Tetrahymena thermophila SB210]